MERRATIVGWRNSLRRAVDWLFVLWIVLVIASAWVFIGAPLVVALGSRLTRLKTSQRKQTWLWGMAVALTLYNVIPILLVWLGLSATFVDERRFTAP